MDSANRPNDTGHTATSSAAQSGHWLPALRPNDEDDLSKSIPSSQPLQTNYASQSVSTEPRIASFQGGDTSETRDNEDVQSPPADLNWAQSQRSPELETAQSKRAPGGGSEQIEAEEMLSEDDDERLDASWGFKRMSTAQILASGDRSTDFPSFGTPAHEATSFDRGDQNSMQEQPVQHQPYVQSPPNAVSTSAQDEGYLDVDRHENDHVGLDHEEQEDTSMVASGPSLEEAAESRFEEGVPLMPHASAEDELRDQPPQSSNLRQFSSWADEDEDTSFFSGINASAQDTTSAPELRRKSTSAVVDSLHVQLKQISEEPTPATDFLQQYEVDETVQMEPPATATDTADDETAPAGVEDVWKAMADDDEFLVEDPDDLLPDSEPESPSSFIASLQEEGTQENNIADDRNYEDMGAIQQTPPSAARPGPHRQSSSNPYAPHQPSTSELAQLSPTTHGNIGFNRPGLGPMNSFQAHLQQRPNAPRAESFADQAKGGYKSPYDLPMELSKPKKRPAMPQLPQSTKAVAPPPRSSSISDKQLQSPFSPSAPGFPATTTPSQPPAPVPPPKPSTASVPPSSAKQKPGSSSFFEELPIVTKPRTGSGHGRFTPQQPHNVPPPQIQPQSPPTSRLPPPQPSPPRQTDPYAQFQLRPPERVDPFSNVPLQSNEPQIPAALSTRYSPAPPATLTGPRPGPSPRYSPAPPAQQSGAPAANRYASQPAAAPPSQPPVQLNRTISQPPPPQPPAVPPLPFQPRTSSPLAYHKNSVDASVPDMPGAAAPPRPRPPQSQYSAPHITAPPTSMRPSAPTQPSHFYSSPPKAIAPEGTVTAPRRSQTQSPSKQRYQPTVAIPNNEAFARPASAHGQMSPTRQYPHMESVLPPQPYTQARGHVQELDFLQPTDDTQFDPLQRWKGAPVFHFGFGGTVVSCFPKHVPRYSAGAVRPQIKPTVGEVSLKRVKDVTQLPGHLSSFPGPLRSKSKKKDLLTWLGIFIAKLEADAPAVLPSQSLPDPRKCHQEKLLLWKVVKSLVEYDGILDGNADALKSINQVLTPEIYHLDESTATQYRDDMISPSGTYRPRGASLKVESMDPMAMQTIRKYLLRGARQEAVWYAVDKRLWSHAILIATTLNRDVWRQVVQEFVKHEVKPAGENTESLSALYEIFGGNLDESIDQLVPPSARAGLQMVSKAEHGGPTKNALDGLDKWKETLSLVLNNRSPGDQGALLALGRLLQDYGRVEAAHICYLFARTASTSTLFGGADDPLASVVLLGADHKKQPFDFARDHEAILLTEVYEFATLVLPGAVTTFMPYLSAYKLRRASLLADSGFKAEAQSYCDALMATMKSTKAPAYYHPTFLGELEDFSNRLKQAPVQTSGSWMAKLSSDKVSGSILSKFSSFVAGDDSDAESKGSGRDVSESGPFAKMAGTPSLSRTGSSSDIYGSYPTSGTATVPLPTTAAGSRYAPNGITSARSSAELTRGRPSLDSQRSPPTSSYGQPSRPSPYDPVNMLQQSQMSPPSNPYQSLSFGASPPSSNYQATPPQSSYMPQGSPARNAMHPRQDSYIPTPPPEQPQSLSYEPKPVDVPVLQRQASESPAFGGFVPTTQRSFDEPPPLLSQPSQGAAEEPSAQSYGYGYEPPNTDYNPYVPEPDSPEQPRQKKKSFMDDDDDFSPASAFKPQSQHDSASAPAPKLSADEKSRRAANDAAAEAAFRAAAEADAARAAGKGTDKQVKPKSSGWFGGWLGSGTKSESLDAVPTQSSSKGGEPKVYRAKLGESKMKLYYDEKLKKWVNPDNPDAALKATATPPPPRMGGTPAPPAGPPRSVSAAPGGPPMGSGSPAMGPPTSSPALGAHTASPALGPPSGPPSRAATPASGASGSLPVSATLPPGVQASLNEGGPASGGGLAPPSRPSTAMSSASSIDDLLGAAGGAGMGRKSVKGKKGGRGRYVDVMAK